jgi:hypothetical protein
MGFHRILLGKGLRLLLMAAGILACLSAGAGVQAQAQGAPSAAGKTMLVEPPPPLLPATLGKLKRAAEGDSGDGLDKVAAAEAPVLTEDGLKRFARSDYDGAGEHGSIAVYKFVDASGALSAYDYFKRPGMRAEKVGDDALSNGSELLLLSGVSVVRADFKAGHAEMLALSKELVDHLPKVAGPTAQPPLLPALLPGRGFDTDSEKYALGPIGYQAMGGVLPADAVGFDKSAETLTAKWKNGGTLTLLIYPTPEIAGDHNRAIEALMNQKVAAGGAAKAAAGTVMLRREGPLLLMTSGPWSAADAHAMVEGIHLHSVLTFDKPMPLEFHTEVKKTYSLLESIVIFCSISLLAMLVLGLFFGGGRALIRVMQGKPAATEPEFLHIDLSGTPGKRLRNPKS